MHASASPGAQGIRRLRPRSPQMIATLLIAGIAISVALAAFLMGPTQEIDTRAGGPQQGADPLTADPPSGAEESSSSSTPESEPSSSELPGIAPCDGEPPAIRPDSMWWACTSANASIDSLTWSAWTAQGGEGEGTLRGNDCVPSCAQGTMIGYPVEVRVHDIVAREHAPVFSKAVVTFVGGSSPYQDGRLVDEVDLLAGIEHLEESRSAPEADMTFDSFDATYIRTSFETVPLNVGQSDFDARAYDGYVPALVKKGPLITSRPCGVQMRPPTRTFHRSSAGYGVEAHDNDLRELFVFPAADAAVDFMDLVRAGVEGCAFDPALDSTFAPFEPLTGYTELVFTETWTDTSSVTPAGTNIWHYMRVGSAVLVQVRGAKGAPAEVGETAGAVATTANQIAPTLCVFTAAGC